ncbi:hypothetical protein T07_15095 [Trichinella nelsoni]|uniref:Uncharacterized protein n=1 Tax=Trichinella nelsoni TaxID=6336 RepID=A0A0V0RUK7_9BILA|nr:hypothetical protein T07_15095 [Trichinella nelsoni]
MTVAATLLRRGTSPPGRAARYSFEFAAKTKRSNSSLLRECYMRRSFTTVVSWRIKTSMSYDCVWKSPMVYDFQPQS